MKPVVAGCTLWINFY